MSNALNAVLHSNLFQSLAVIMAASVISMGAASAQDFEGVERKLGESVADGEISLEQALLMMNALRESVERQQFMEHHEREERPEHLELHEKVEIALVNADFKDRQIAPALDVIFDSAHRILEQGERFEPNERTLHFLKNEVKLTPEKIEMVFDIAKKVAEHKHNDHLEIRKRDYHEIVQEIKAAVRHGDLSEYDANRKIEEIQKEMFPEHVDRHEASKDVIDIREAMQEIREAVKNGDLSEREARLKAMDLRLNAAIQQGKMTEDEAKAKKEELLNKLD